MGHRKPRIESRNKRNPRQKKLCAGPMPQPITEPIRAVAFDVDGTLVNTFENVSLAIQETFRAFGLQVPELRRIREVYSADDEFRQMLRVLDVPEELLTKENGEFYPFAVKCWCEICPRLEKEKPSGLVPGAAEVLRDLSAAGVPLFVISSANSERINGTLERLGIKAFFGESRIFTSHAHKSQILRRIKTDVCPSKLLYVGDMISDCVDSITAGVHFGALYHQYSYSPSSAFSEYESHPLFIRIAQLREVARLVLGDRKLQRHADAG